MVVNLQETFVKACLFNKAGLSMVFQFPSYRISPGGGGGGGGVLQYMGYISMCRCEGYGFQAVYSRIGYINQNIWVQNGASFFRKLISWFKILSRQGNSYSRIGGIWGVYSSIGQQNLAELALVQVEGSRVPAAHPYPEIPKVPPPPLRGFPQSINQSINFI